MEPTKKNTLVFEFPKDAMGPSLFEMSRFGKKLIADRTMMDTCYRNADEKSVYIRFKTAEAFNDAVLYNSEIHTFEYNDGSTVHVKMSVAGGMYKYVRIFNLPPEVSDEEISRVVGRYGKIRKQVREKFPPECEFDVYSGIRGVYMDIQKQIPAALFIRNSKARIYYEGFKNRCFHCKADDHLKVNCPQLQEGQNDGQRERQEEEQQQGPLPYAKVASEASSTLAQRLHQIRNMVTNERPQDETMDKTEGSGQSALGEELLSGGEVDSVNDDPDQSGDMDIDETRNSGTKRALRALQSTSDESNDGKVRPGKPKGTSKRTKNSSTGSSGNESLLEAIKNVPKDNEMTKVDNEKGWSTVNHKNTIGKKGGKKKIETAVESNHELR